MTSKPPADTVESPANPPGKRVRAAKNLKRFGRYLKDKWIYFAIAAFCVGGLLILLWALLCFSSTNSDATRNVYYFLIFIGANFATAIAIWRGRQSKQQLLHFERQIQNSRFESERQIRQSKQQINQFERQLENSRFEKALEMATDLKNRGRRASGVRILMQMLSAWRENFNDTTMNNTSVLHYINVINFQLTKGEQQEAFKVLYTKSKNSYNPSDAINLYEMTHDPLINLAALGLWQEIMNWRRKKFPTPDTSDDSLIAGGIYSSKTRVDEPTLIIFSGMNLSGLKFFIALEDGRICFPTEGMRVNFRYSCFLQVEMHKASVDHVDFSESHLFNINIMQKEQLDYSMSCIGTIFNFANLINCNFRGADFKNASFIGTNISGSDFSRAKNLTPEQFQKGTYWIKPGSPQFPNNFPPSFADDLPNHPPKRENKGQREVKVKPLP